MKLDTSETKKSCDYNFYHLIILRWCIFELVGLLRQRIRIFEKLKRFLKDMNQITKRKKKITFANSKSHLRKNLEIRFIVRISGAKSYFCYFLAL